jgi:RPC5 protein
VPSPQVHLKSDITVQPCSLRHRANALRCKRAGVVRDNKLLLVPVDNALQLRPSLAHLDKAAAVPGALAAGTAEAAEEEDVKPELQAVKVSMHPR